MTLLDLLTCYVPLDENDRRQAKRIREFIEADPRSFDRQNPVGHITGSAWVVDPTGTRVLLTHHKKLGKWLQVGGHADGERDVMKVALREAQEESGLTDLLPVSSEIFDVDIHPIPAHGSDPAHEHFDVRFAFQARDTAFKVSEESHALAWIEIRKIHEFTSEESLLRMARKWRTRRIQK